MLFLYFSFYFIVLLYDSGTANQISKLCSWFQRLETSTSLSKEEKNKCKGKRNRAKPNWICLYFVFCGYCFWLLFPVSFFFNLWVSPYISIYHYIFVFICYPDFIYESCRQILWRAFLRRCSEGKKGNQNWQVFSSLGRCGCQSTQETVGTFQLMRFCYQGIDTCSFDRFCCCCCRTWYLSAKVRICPSPIRIQWPSRQSSLLSRALPHLMHVTQRRADTSARSHGDLHFTPHM